MAITWEVHRGTGCIKQRRHRLASQSVLAASTDLQRVQKRRTDKRWSVGTAWMVGEDVTDKYFVQPFERRTYNRVVLALVRSLLNPSRSLSNLVSGRTPWHRDGRPALNALR
jgi:hypothetical protein